MTKAEAMAAADGLYPNTIPAEQKERWLAELEGRIYWELCGKEGSTEACAEVCASDQLQVPSPHDSLYVYWLMAKCALHQNDNVRHNAFTTVYNDLYAEYRRLWVRTHTGRGAVTRIWG